jgi:hypothetical protein
MLYPTDRRIIKMVDCKNESGIGRIFYAILHKNLTDDHVIITMIEEKVVLLTSHKASF